MNSHPSSVSTRSIVRVGGGAPATTMRVRAAAGDLAVPLLRGVEDRGDDRGRAAQQRDAVVAHPPQDLGAVDLAQNDVAAAHAGDRVRHPPAVAVEHRQRVQEHVAVVDTSCASRTSVAFSQMLRCVSCTPFGRAVVPLV